MESKYREPYQSLSEVLQKIERTPSGSLLLQRFFPDYRSGKIQVFSTDKKSINRKSGHSSSVNAVFQFDGKVRKIYIDPLQCLGKAIPTLSHEICHSTDMDYIKSFFACQEIYRKAKTADVQSQFRASGLLKARAEKLLLEFQIAQAKRIFEAEKKAYRMQHQIVAELAEQDEAYREFVLELQAQGERIGVLTSDESILERHKLSKLPQNSARVE